MRRFLRWMFVGLLLVAVVVWGALLVTPNGRDVFGHGRAVYEKMLDWYQRRFDRRQVWMTVFVHGTFGSGLGLLDLGAVRQDSTDKTLYRRVVGMMREHPVCCRCQPIACKRGLCEVEPSFAVSGPDGGLFAAAPIAQAYEVALDATNPGHERNLYYVFGWSGLISQRRRRTEAVRLYNALVEERDRLRAQGIEPKIRVIAHSHGGNLLLNVAGIWELCNGGIRSLPSAAQDPHLCGVHEAFAELFGQLGSWEKTLTASGQKRLDYRPIQTDLHIDQGIMLGTPIQPETAYFARSPLFGELFNIYSVEDFVQETDPLSTNRGQSEKRLEKGMIGGRADLERPDGGRILQIRVTAGRRHQPPGESAVERTAIWWELLLGLRKTIKTSDDPTHMELFFVVPSSSPAADTLKPLPVAGLLPLILELVEQDPKHNDLAVDFSSDDRQFWATATPQGGDGSGRHLTLERGLIDHLRERMKPFEDTVEHARAERRLLTNYIAVGRSEGLQ